MRGWYRSALSVIDYPTRDFLLRAQRIRDQKRKYQNYELRTR